MLASALVGCSSSVTVLAWHTPVSCEPAQADGTTEPCGGPSFPEGLPLSEPAGEGEMANRARAHQLDLQYLANRLDFGVAFSGGGARAATAALGQLRALHQLRWPKDGGTVDNRTLADEVWDANPGPSNSHSDYWALIEACEASFATHRSDRWIDKIRYTSGVSGGAWALTAYAYQLDPEEEERDEKKPRPGHRTSNDCQHLGALVRPKHLTKTLLEDPNGLFATSVAQGNGFLRNFAKYYRVAQDEAYARTVGDLYLSMSRINNQRMSFTAGPAGAKIMEEQLGTPFYYPKQGRPFLIAGATLFAHPVLKDDDDTDLLPMDITPLYSGVRHASGHFTDDNGRKSWRFGGGFMESFALEAQVTGRQSFSDKRTHVAWTGTLRDWKTWFTLSDLVGVTGSAAAETVSRFGIRPHVVGAAARYHHYPLLAGQGVGEDAPALPADHNAEHLYGDGAFLDNLGVATLLARRVQNIIAFVNTPHSIDEPVALDDLRALFGHHRNKCKTHVLASDELGGVLKALRQDEANQDPLVHCQRHTVVHNPVAGISKWAVANYHPMICWVYLDGVDKWLQEVGTGPRRPDGHTCVPGKWIRGMRAGKEPFLRFPHYNTMLQDQGQILDLDTPQTNALANLTAWTLVESAGTIFSALSQPPERPLVVTAPSARSSVCPPFEGGQSLRREHRLEGDE